MKCPKCQTDNPGDSKFCKECATLLVSAEKLEASVTKTLETIPYELARGMIFSGRYEIIEELGTGGMGKVYRAFDKKIEEEVALKLIRQEIAANRKAIDRFKNELKVARKITHKNVCKMYDLGESEGTSYITMEYVPGEDLKSLIHRTKALTIGTSTLIARQVAEALSEAHKLGVVHRDLKPGNIMIDKDGNAKIMDFGIARSLLGKGLTGEGAIIGTPEYMSPEQVEGKEADPRADIYALGIILFEMVTGRVPFEGATPFSIANKHKSEPPPVPKKLNPHIPDSLNRLILRCLEKEKEKRYQSADELLADLMSVEEALPVAERTVSKRKAITSREITVKFQPRKVVIPTAVILVLAVAGFFLWRNLFKPRPPFPSAKPTLAVLYFKNSSGDPTLDIWKENLPTLLAIGLGQSRYLRLVDDPAIYGILKKLNLLDAEKYSSEELKNIAAESRATHILSGNYLTAGSKFIINLSLIDAKTGSFLKPIQEETSNKDTIYNSVDVLVKKIKVGLNIPEQLIDEDTYKTLGEVYTRNPQALQNYIEGVRFHQNFKFAEAIKSLERAVELDQEFAMAYLMLGLSYGNSGNYLERYQHTKKAYELRDKLPEKDRLVVEGNLYMLREKTALKAIDVLKKAVERYPDDFLARSSLAYAFDVTDEDDEEIKEFENLISICGENQARSLKLYYDLADLYCKKWDYSRARECYERAVKANPSDADDRVSLGYLFMLEKKFDDALREFEKAIAIAPDNPSLKITIADYYFLRDELEKSRQILEALRKVSTDASLLADLCNCFTGLNIVEGKFQEALNYHEELEKVLKSQERILTFMYFMLLYRGKFHLQTGNPGKALDEFREAMEYFKKEADRLQDIEFIQIAFRRRLCLMWQVCALCDMGNISEAETLCKEFERLIPDYIKKKPGRRGFSSNLEFLEGKIALSKKNIPEAIRMLEAGWKSMGGERFWSLHLDHAYLLDMMADAYQFAGRLDKAVETYGRIQEFQAGRWVWGAIYARSYYKLGKVYEQMGKKAEARANYQKFLDLWKNADAGLPEVEDAVKRLATL